MTAPNAWTRAQVVDALPRYEQELVAIGRTPGTIATYLGDARRFIDWLTGESAPVASALARRSVIRRRHPLMSRSTPPATLIELLSEWQRAARPQQPGIAWPKGRWLTYFPDQGETLRGMPQLLDRPAVREIASRAADGLAQAEAAFVATMAWGFGYVGYGPFRTDRMLRATPDATRRLMNVAVSIRDEGAVAAYARLGSDCRIKGLGPAFGTKFLAFSQPARQQPVALIHDDLVSSWLSGEGRSDLSQTGWSTSTYAAYLDQMHTWAEVVKEDPETIEYLIFQVMANARGSQWSR
jgi:hypothetical protein